MTNEPILIYDIKSFPEDFDFEGFLKLWKEQRIVLWDSTNEGTEPKVLSVEEIELKIVDLKEISKDEIK